MILIDCGGAKAKEEKQRRKEEKKAVKAKANAAGGPAEDASDAESEVQFDGVTGLSSGRTTKPSKKAHVEHMDVEEEEEEVPALINSDLPNLQSVIDSADVIVQILDARDPLRYRSEHLEELAGNKKMLLVLNKVGACQWISTCSQRILLMSVNAKMRVLANP